MTTVSRIVFFVLLTVSVRAAPIDDPTGMLLRLHTSVRLPAVSQDRDTDYLLGPGGLCVGLYAFFEPRNGSGMPSTVSIPADGPWTYRRVSETSLELTLPSLGKQILEFVTAASGVVGAAVGIATTFELVPYEAGTPLTNCSNRSQVNAGGAAFTGFVIPSASRGRVLIRAVGPGLQQFGVANALKAPALTVVRAAQTQVVASNSGWSSTPEFAAVMARVGAFGLPAASKDSALFLSLAPGAYIAEVRGTDPTDSGQVLIEVYMCP